MKKKFLFFCNSKFFWVKSSLKTIFPFFLLFLLALGYLWQRNYGRYLEMKISSLQKDYECQKGLTSELQTQYSNLTSYNRMDELSVALGIHKGPPETYVTLKEEQTDQKKLIERYTIIRSIKNIFVSNSNEGNEEANKGSAYAIP